MSTEEALIIFVKEPVLGRVKTRLAAAIGDRGALEIYERLLNHTDEVTEGRRRFVFHTGDRNLIDHFSSNDVWVKQVDGDLGERMFEAFRYVLSKGFSRVAIIGSDCAQLTTEIINDAFGGIAPGRLVIGPAYDGGYYLLGLNEINEDLFREIPWSTEDVAGRTIAMARYAGLEVVKLPMLRDVDTLEDLEATGWK